MTPARRGHLAMLTFSSCVAGSFSLGAMAAPLIGPAALNAARFAIAIGVLAGVALATGGIPRRALAAPWRYLLLGGLFTIYFVLMFEGLKTADPVAAAAVFTLTPAMSAGFGWLFLRQRTTARMGLALALGAAGAAWVIFRGDPAAALALRIGPGEAVYFLGCVAHAAYTPLVARLNRGERPVVFTLGMLVAGLAILAVYGAGQIAATPWADLPAIVWIAMVYLAVVASAASFVLLQYATLRLPSAKVMAYTYLVPGWVALWEIALGRPAPPALVLVGVAATAGALIALLKDETRPPPRPAG